METTQKTGLVSLVSLSGGAVGERFDIALQEVLNNIIDPNTEAKKARSISLKFTVKPSDDREFCVVSISSDVKLAPISPLNTEIFLGKKGGKTVACERSTRQSAMFEETPLPANVTPLPTKEAAHQ